MSEIIFTWILLYCAIGALVGAGYFSALRWNVELYVRGRFAGKAVFAHLVRLLMIAGAFTLCARQGAPALIASLIGFQLARVLVVNKDLAGVAKSI